MEQDWKLLSKDNSHLEQQNKQRASVDDEGSVPTEGDSGLQPEDQEIMLPDGKSMLLESKTDMQAESYRNPSTR